MTGSVVPPALFARGTVPLVLFVLVPALFVVGPMQAPANARLPFLMSVRSRLPLLLAMAMAIAPREELHAMFLLSLVTLEIAKAQAFVRPSASLRKAMPLLVLPAVLLTSRLLPLRWNANLLLVSLVFLSIPPVPSAMAVGVVLQMPPKAMSALLDVAVESALLLPLEIPMSIVQVAALQEMFVVLFVIL